MQLTIEVASGARLLKIVYMYVGICFLTFFGKPKNADAMVVDLIESVHTWSLSGSPVGSFPYRNGCLGVGSVSQVLALSLDPSRSRNRRCSWGACVTLVPRGGEMGVRRICGAH